MNRYNTTEKIDKKHSKIEQIDEDSVINITFQISTQSDIICIRFAHNNHQTRR